MENLAVNVLVIEVGVFLLVVNRDDFKKRGAVEFLEILPCGGLDVLVVDVVLQKELFQFGEEFGLPVARRALMSRAERRSHPEFAARAGVIGA